MSHFGKIEWRSCPIKSSNAVFVVFKHVKFWSGVLGANSSDYLLKILYLRSYNFNPGSRNFCQFFYLKLCIENFFYGNFPCLKMFELSLGLWSYNSLLGPGTNQKRSQHWFYRYMHCYALETHGGSSWKETWAENLRQGNFDNKWRIIVYNWLEVKLLFCSSIKQISQCYL